MRVLITGGAGFIGRRLGAHLADHGHDVRALDAGFTARLDEVDSRVSLLRLDLAALDQAALQAMLAGTEVVFHLAARKHNTPGVSADDVLATNVSATWHLAEAAAAAGVRRMVFTSSLYAHGGMGPAAMRESDVPLPKTLYGSTKLMGERMLDTVGAMRGLEWNAARLFFTYGPGQHADGGYKSVIVGNFERMASGLAPVIRGDGEQALDYVYVDDVVEALTRLGTGEPSGHVLNVASGVGVTINAVVAAMSDVAGYTGQIDHQPADWTAGTRRFGDVSRIAEIFGWRARTDLAAGLAAAWHDLRP